MFTFLIIFYVLTLLFGVVIFKMSLSGLPATALLIMNGLKAVSSIVVMFWSVYQIFKIWELFK